MWLIKQEAAGEIARLYRTNPSPTSEQRLAFKTETKLNPEARATARASKPADGGVASIEISGVLVKNPSFLLWLMGMDQTPYSAIQEALAQASADARVTSAVLHIDSPGGQVDGLFECLAAIQAFDKPLSVVATQACSAAYAIAATAGQITASAPSASFGSIGVAASIGVEKDVIDLTSTEAPDKRPDVTTDEGKAVVVKHLDAIHALFADAIAKGRDTTVDAVNAGFGRGAVVLAADAKSRGMIDAVVKPASNKAARKVGAVADADQAEITTMDLRTLKAQHPDVFDAAAAEGCAAERERISAHMTMGATGGDEGRALATAAVDSGAPFNMAAMARYQALALNRRDRDLRSDDDKEATAADGADQAAAPAKKKAATTDTTAPAAAVVYTTETVGDEVARRMMAARGKKVA